jgi:pimeloyl-ACP methyl ester carboxylesterase
VTPFVPPRIRSGDRRGFATEFRMIIGIEGTGSQGWGDLDLRRTFVRRILHSTTHRPASYFIGPGNTGMDGSTIIAGAYQALVNGAHNAPIILVGYSRGAAYCMEIAKRWKKPIDILVLFDAVARQGDIDIPEKVPGNVVKCFHAYRDARTGSRYFFGNVGLYPESRSTDFKKKMFPGSHGAIGGTWYDAANDEGTKGNYTGAAVTRAFGGGVDDRQKLPVGMSATTDIIADKKAADAVADWIWPLLVEAGVVPAKSERYHTAPPFTGSRTAGVRNVIK